MDIKVEIARGEFYNYKCWKTILLIRKEGILWEHT